MSTTRNDVIPSVDASKVYFVASLLTQYWLACKLTCTKRNFDTHQSVTDITAAIGTPWLHKLWLGLVLTTGRSSITTFVPTSVDWWLCLWPSAKLQPNFGCKMKLSCRGHDHASPYAYDLFRVTYLIWNQACTCVQCICTQKIANICDCSSSPPLDDAMIFQTPSFAFTMFMTNYTVPWTIIVENIVISEMCYAIQLRLTGQVK